MYCKNCGHKLAEHAKFCANCGAAIKAPEGFTEEQQKKTNLQKAWVIGVIGAAAAIALAAGIFFVVSKRGDEELYASMGEPSGMDQETETPLYTITDIGSIDLSVRNHTPGVKKAGIEWDRNLFYWLEDVNPDSLEDGNLSRCLLTKTQLRDAASGNVIQYDIYKDADDGTVYKIVSMEAQPEGGYLLTDYYYLSGVPNFIFLRTDSVYTPTYATPSKVGERFYFSDDVLVRWRKIETPGEIRECTLTMMDVSYPQTDYFEETEEIRAEYDVEELEKLNEAYSTLEAVIGQPVVGTVSGGVCDTLGQPMSGLTVNIYRTEDGVLLYQGITEDDGSFCILVYLDGTDCSLSIKGDETYRDITAQGLQLADTALTYSYEDFVRHKNNGDEYQVQLILHSAVDVSTEEGNVGSPISGVTATFREGTSVYTGEAALVQSGENGIVTANLQSGTYTVQLEAEGYADSYVTVEVAETAVEQHGYLLPTPSEGQTGIVVSWEGEETDLDLTVFTPYQSTAGDMAYIGGSVLNDGKGNYIVADNHAGCEAAYINTAEQGTFKLYVNDFTDSEAGNYTAGTFPVINVHIYIYNSDGFVAEYAVPAGQNGVLWEVAEISGNRITPSQRVYTQLDGKLWWTTKITKALLHEQFKEKLSELTLQYGSFDTEQSGTMSRLDDFKDNEWLVASGIMSATILDFDSDGLDEMMVCISEKCNHRDDSIYYDGPYHIMMYMYEYNAGEIIQADAILMGPYLESKYMDLPMYELPILSYAAENSIIAVNTLLIDESYYVVCEYSATSGFFYDGYMEACWLLEYTDGAFEYVGSFTQDGAGSEVFSYTGYMFSDGICVKSALYCGGWEFDDDPLYPQFGQAMFAFFDDYKVQLDSRTKDLEGGFDIMLYSGDGRIQSILSPENDKLLNFEFVIMPTNVGYYTFGDSVNFSATLSRGNDLIE